MSDKITFGGGTSIADFIQTIWEIPLSGPISYLATPICIRLSLLERGGAGRILCFMDQ